MKNKFLILLGFNIIIGCMASSNKNKLNNLTCSEDVKTILSLIKKNYSADSVAIYIKNVKEELYFSEIKSPVVEIYNSTTKTLDFKSLPITHYQRFNDFEQIEDSLKLEGLPIALELTKRCDMSEFNDLILEFLKTDNEGKTLYRFICHYKELLK